MASIGLILCGIRECRPAFFERLKEIRVVVKLYRHPHAQQDIGRKMERGRALLDHEGIIRRCWVQLGRWPPKIPQPGSGLTGSAVHAIDFVTKHKIRARQRGWSCIGKPSFLQHLQSSGTV